jgi:hypothetical protein
MKNQNSISKSNVIVKPVPSTSGVITTGKDKPLFDKRMENEITSQLTKQSYTEQQTPKNSQMTADGSSIALTDKVNINRKYATVVVKFQFLLDITLISTCHMSVIVFECHH